MSRIGTNILANFLGRGWAIVSVYLFIPFYVEILGIEAYGVVGFYSVLFGVFSFANFGLTATLSREIARLSTNVGNEQEIRDLAFTIETIFRIIAIIIAVLVNLLAPTIAKNWVNTQTVSVDAVSRGIQLMGIAMSLRFPTDLCHGGLLGLQKQVISNAIVAGAGSIRGLGSIIVLCYFAPTIEVFFAWQILVNFFEAVLVSRVLKAYVNPNHEIAKFRTNVLRSTWKYAAGMTGISLISIVLSEVDKIVVCSILTLESFGIYSIATILSRAPSTIGSPIADAIFPKLTQLVSKDDTVGVIKLYHLACQLVSVVSIPTGIVIAIFSQELITIWTQNSQIGIEGRYTTSVLVIGTVCLSIMIVPFRLALAHGWTSLNFIIGVFSIIIVLPLVTALTLLLGNLGAAIGWLALNLGMLAPFVIILHNRILPGQTITWFICDTGLPLIASLVSIGLARFLYIETLIQVFQLTEIAIAWLMGVVTSMLAAPMVRILLIEQYQMRIMRFRKRKQ